MSNGHPCMHRVKKVASISIDKVMNRYPKRKWDIRGLSHNSRHIWKLHPDPVSIPPTYIMSLNVLFSHGAAPSVWLLLTSIRFTCSAVLNLLCSPTCYCILKNIVSWQNYDDPCRFLILFLVDFVWLLLLRVREAFRPRRRPHSGPIELKPVRHQTPTSLHYNTILIML